MTRIMAAVLLSFVVAGFGALSPVQAQVRRDVLVVREGADPREALAQRYVDLTTGGADKIVRQMMTQTISGFGPEVDSDHRQWFLNNAADILMPHMPHMQRFIADIRADIQTRFTVAELEAMIAFYDAPQGRAIAAKQAEMGGALGMRMQAFQQAYTVDLMTKFCGAFDCEVMAREAAGAGKPPKR